MPQITTSTLRGVKVYSTDKPDKAIGKVHQFIFHPHKRRVVGFTVKRPDVALMFHRSELFVAFDSFTITDGLVYVEPGRATTGQAACKRLGLSWDDCIIWEGLALLTEEGECVGHVGEVTFSLDTGDVCSLRVDRGASNKALLGVIDLDPSLVKGFQLGVGDSLSTVAETDDEHDTRGALIVKPEALDAEQVGGLAEKAGTGYAKAAHQVKMGADKAREGIDKARPVAMEAASKTSDAVNKGAYKVGEQLGKTRGMFSNFKKAYHEALGEGESDTSEN